jgi:hypothetical protein
LPQRQSEHAEAAAEEAQLAHPAKTEPSTLAAASD